MRVLIVDDEPLAIARLRRLCTGIDGVEVIGAASNGAMALEQIGALVPDIVLLDVTMPEVDGIAVARAVRRAAKRPSIVFVTAHDNFAVLAFEVAATDYLLKPVQPERLEEALRRIPSNGPEPGTDNPEIWVSHHSGLVRLERDAINLVEAERDYVRLHVGTRSYLLRSTIGEIEERLGSDAFTRVHRSFVVPRRLIRCLRRDAGGSWSVGLLDGRLVPAGRTFLPRLAAFKKT